MMNGMMNDPSSSTAMKNGMLNLKQGWWNRCDTTSKMSGESLLQQMERAGFCEADLTPSTCISSHPSTSPHGPRAPSYGDAFLSHINGIFEPNIINGSSQEDLFEPEPLTPQSGHQQNRVRSSSLENCLNLALEQIDTDTDDYLFDDALEQIDTETEDSLHIETETDDSLFDDFADPCNSNNKRCAHVAIPTQEPEQKRRRTTAHFINNISGSDDTSPRFRPYQQKQWDDQFQELLAFKKARGHCCVPHKSEETPILSRWVSAAY
jgi:hypothetical protein